MEISHASTETQSVAVGINGQAEEVTVSTDAEFMMMIAHGIYSNKPLALVRELVCNARDGHAKAGKLDEPIRITLTDNKLVVRDHGTGIPNEIFARTYMTFGKSTKRQDKSATGGFGVGTKVPWAVCDVFSARNFINGTMTAYSIVKSDPAKDGKPTCTPVVSIPSTESSGVEVSVPFPEKMHTEIAQFIRLFANELGIPVILNGEKVRIDYPEHIQELKQYGYTRLSVPPRTVIQSSNFYVRQGDVIYPIERQEEFADAFNMLNLLNPHGHNPILFMAEPDSIIPTLSRESLQYTERTCVSIRNLMKKALQEVADQVDVYAERTNKYLYEHVTNLRDFPRLMWKHEFQLTTYLNEAHKKYIKIDTLSETQNLMLLHNMTRWLNSKTPYLETPQVNAKLFREDLKERIKSSFVEFMKKYTYFNHERLVEIWKQGRDRYNRSHSLTTNMTRHMYEELMFWRAESTANPEIVDVYFTKDEHFSDARTTTRISYYFLELSEIKDLDTRKETVSNRFGDFLMQTVYASNTVVISSAPQAMMTRAIEKYEHTDLAHNLFVGHAGRIAGARCVRIRASTKPDQIKAMKASYESLGYDVIVLLDPTKAELAEKARLAAERAALKEIPLPMLHELIGAKIPKHPAKEAKEARRKLKGIVESPALKGEPLYFILGRGKDLPYNLNTVSDYVLLTKFIGTDIICVSTKPEIARVVKEGRRSVEDALMEFMQWFFKKPGIHEKLFYMNTLFTMRASQNKYLTKLLFNRVPPVMDQQEQKIYEGLRSLMTLYTSTRKYWQTKQDLYTRCAPEDHYFKVFQKYAEDNFCDVHRALETAYARKPSRKRAIARSILKTILLERPA